MGRDGSEKLAEIGGRQLGPNIEAGAARDLELRSRQICAEVPAAHLHEQLPAHDRHAFGSAGIEVEGPGSDGTDSHPSNLSLGLDALIPTFQVAVVLQHGRLLSRFEQEGIIPDTPSASRRGETAQGGVAERVEADARHRDFRSPSPASGERTPRSDNCNSTGWEP